jgi:hypothetical protein
MGLFTGTLPPNIAKWFWWRFNGMGFAGGIISGIAAAIIQKLTLSSAPPFVTFGFVVFVSAIGSIIGTFLGKPTDMDTLVKFYKQIKPFGFWEPIRKLCEPDFVSDVRKENRHDLLLLVPACVWQMTLFWMMTAIVAQKWISVGGSFVVVVLLSIFLYKYWYKELKTT